MNILLENEFLFITKQGFFIFLDKLSKVILTKVKKDLTKLIFNFCNSKARQTFTNKSLSFEKLKKFKLLCSL